MTDHRPTATGPGEARLSVVIVTYNEADRIEACLESVFDCAAAVGEFEAVLVDSRSTDDTVARARQFPVEIRRLPDGVDRTPSAGRYVGTLATSGDLLLFVDGDAILEPGWLAAACERVRSAPDLAGVDGHLNESTATEARPTDALRGVALYDRTALTAVGGFDPHLESLEDIDVGYRLTAAGYDLLRLPDVVATHPFEDSLSERLRRWRHGYYRGRGQLLRKSVDSPVVFTRVFFRSSLYVALAVWLFVGLAATLGLGPVGVLSWGVLSVLGTAAAAAVKGPAWTFGKVTSTIPFVVGTLLGASDPRPPREAYPVEEVEIVQRTQPPRPEPSG